MILAFCATLGSCSPKILPSHNDNIQHKDSTSVNVTVRDSLIYVPVPLEKDQVIAHIGDTSKLETSIAQSTAYIGNDGFLYHSLENKSKERLPAIVPITTKVIYAGVSHIEAHTLTKYVEVEKPLSGWKLFQIRAFWWLLLALGAALLYIFRKPVLAIIKILLKI